VFAFFDAVICTFALAIMLVSNRRYGIGILLMLFGYLFLFQFIGGEVTAINKIIYSINKYFLKKGINGWLNISITNVN
jgi:hypothetical protein